MFLTLIDYEKAFDRVDHNLLWTRRQLKNINGRVLEVIRNLYEKQKHVLESMESYQTYYRIDVRREDSFLLFLFIVYIIDFKHFISQKFSGIELQSETSLNSFYETGFSQIALYG